jgi:hypothetical protein
VDRSPAFNYPQFAIRRACEEMDVTALQGSGSEYGD